MQIEPAVTPLSEIQLIFAHFNVIFSELYLEMVEGNATALKIGLDCAKVKGAPSD